MTKLQILLGFEDAAFQAAIVRKLYAKGYEVDVVNKFSKISIKEFLQKNPNCNTVVLKEMVGNHVSFEAEEVAALTDSRDVNVIIVLNEQHIGTDYMRILNPLSEAGD